MARSQILLLAVLGLLVLAAAGGDSKYGYGAEVGHYKEEIKHIGYKLRKSKKHHRRHRKCRRGHRWHKMKKHCVKIHRRHHKKAEYKPVHHDKYEAEYKPVHHDKYEREEREYGYEREYRPAYNKYEREERKYGYEAPKYVAPKYEAPKYVEEVVEEIENTYAKLPGYTEAVEYFNTYGRDLYVKKYGADKYGLL